MIKINYESPAVEIVTVVCDDVITTSGILLPPFEFGSSKSSEYGEYDVF